MEDSASSDDTEQDNYNANFYDDDDDDDSYMDDGMDEWDGASSSSSASPPKVIFIGSEPSSELSIDRYIYDYEESDKSGTAHFFSSEKLAKISHFVGVVNLFTPNQVCHSMNFVLKSQKIYHVLRCQKV